MADTLLLDNGDLSDVAAPVDTIAGLTYPYVKLAQGLAGTATIVSSTNPLPVTDAGSLTNTQLRATPVDVAVNAASISSDHSSVGQLVNYAAHWDGNTANAPTALPIKYFSATVAASQTDSSLIAAVTSKRLTILSLAVQCGGTATDITFESSTTTRIHKVPAGANGGQVLPSGTAPWFRTASGESLTVTTGTGSSVEISGSYVEAPA